MGLAWLGRNNRSADPTITATVTFGDSTTSMASVTLDGTSGLADGLKDVFIGFDDPTGTGITKLTVSSDQRHFNGWDDIGVVVPEPSSIVLGGLSLFVFGIRPRCSRL